MHFSFQGKTEYSENSFIYFARLLLKGDIPKYGSKIFSINNKIHFSRTSKKPNKDTLNDNASRHNLHKSKGSINRMQYTSE